MTKKDDEKKRDDPYALRDILTEMEMDLVRSFQRNMVKHSIDEINVGFSWEMWQIALLRNIDEYHHRNKEIIGEYRPAVKAAIKDVLNHSYQSGKEKAEAIAEQAQIQLDAGSFSFPQDDKNISKVGTAPPREEYFFKINEKKMNALIQSTTDDFEEVAHAVYRKMDDVYRQTIFNAEFQLSSGAISLGKAIDKATEAFLSKGIDCIIYSNGRRVNIADYAEMALRTASHRATLLGEGTIRDKYNNHLIFVSAHANSCRLCLPWQGQVLIDDVFSHPTDDYLIKYKGKYKLLSEAIKAGLLHPNCRHTLTTYFEGITRLPKQQDPKKAIENYNNEQKQRKLEREIRKCKRILAGTVEEDAKKKARANLSKAQKNLRDFLKEHPEFKRNQRREKVYRISSKLGNGFTDTSVQSASNGKYVETIDIKDIDKYIEKYENEIKDAKIEHAYVIHEDGKVMHYTGTEKGVNILSENLRNAIITHNHPIIEDVPSNGFQKDDFSFLQGHGLEIKRLRATYGDIRYEVKVLKDLSQLSFSEYRIRGSAMIDITADYIDMEENAYLLLAKEGYIEYTKTKTEVK